MGKIRIIIMWIVIYLAVVGIYKGVVWLADHHPQVLDFILPADPNIPDSDFNR